MDPHTLGQNNSPWTLKKGTGRTGKIEARALPPGLSQLAPDSAHLPATGRGPRESPTRGPGQALGACYTFLPALSQGCCQCARPIVRFKATKMNRIVPALCLTGKAKFRTLNLKAITTGHLLCTRHWRQTREETRGRQPGERDGDKPGSYKGLSGCSFPSLCPAPATAHGDLLPAHPHVSTLR